MFVAKKVFKAGGERISLGNNQVCFTLCPKLFVDPKSEVMEFLLLDLLTAGGTSVCCASVSHIVDQILLRNNIKAVTEFFKKNQKLLH
jgi:hypothetical protein